MVHNVDMTLQTPTELPERDGSQAIRRTMSVLRALAVGQASGVGLQDVVHATGLARPTAHRILKALIAERMVEQHARSRRYAVGEEVTMLALARTRRPAVLDAAENVVDEVARLVGDTVFLTARVGDDTLCLVRRLGSYPVQVLAIEVGVRRPLGVSSSGTAILSQMAPEDAVAIVSRNQPRFESYRMSVAQVLEHVAVAQRQGFYCSDRGIVPGTRALSVPIVGVDGAPVAALTLVGVRDRMRPARQLELQEVLLRYVGAVAAQLAVREQGSPSVK